ncbi:MAG: pyridoxamine 5-phosphate oxidase [Pyrinomonadaceae bacterium]|jgi:pyridoxamine 5'-phosphate oxidase|nr:pyridoxamine 5-phosphate oxidase [Pyrinomonadaceae bacterium]
MSQNDKQKSSPSLDETTVDRDPIKLFRLWFDDAIASGSRLPESMTLATATPDGKPSARVVLLKNVDANGFVFYTNYRSAKAQELDQNPHAALVFYWVGLDRQVRVEGGVERVSAAESDEYFKTRPRESQLGALASPQSEVIESREVLERRLLALEQEYRDREVERPAHWGGYRLKPERIEFWENRPGRLHDRIAYDLQADGSWSIKRLAP